MNSTIATITIVTANTTQGKRMLISIFLFIALIVVILFHRKKASKSDVYLIIKNQEETIKNLDDLFIGNRH